MTNTDYAKLGNLTPWLEFSRMDSSSVVVERQSSREECLSGGLSKQKVMRNKGTFWIESAAYSTYLRICRPGPAPCFVLTDVIPGPLNAAEALKRLHKFDRTVQLYNPVHKDRPLLPDRKNPTRAMPRRVLAKFIKVLGAKAADPMAMHLTPYSMRIGHATHI